MVWRLSGEKPVGDYQAYFTKSENQLWCIYGSISACSSRPIYYCPFGIIDQWTFPVIRLVSRIILPRQSTTFCHFLSTMQSNTILYNSYNMMCTPLGSTCIYTTGQYILLFRRKSEIEFYWILYILTTKSIALTCKSSLRWIEPQSSVFGNASPYTYSIHILQLVYKTNPASYSLQ